MRTSLGAVGRYRIRVRTWGSDRSPPAIVLPGMAADGRALAPQVRLLRRLGYATHVIELPGFGVDPPLREEDAHFRDLAEMVVEAASGALDGRRALVLGHSLGGGLALYVALARPRLVERLVLLAPAAVGDSLLWLYRLFAAPLLGRALLRPSEGASPLARHFLVGSRRRGDRHFVDGLLRRDRRSASATRSMRAIVWANQPRGWQRLRAAVLPGGEQAGFTLRGRLRELAGVPTLVLWGAEDRVLSARDARYLLALGTSAEVHVAPGIGHSLPLEAPQWVSDRIARFLARQAQASRGIAA